MLCGGENSKKENQLRTGGDIEWIEVGDPSNNRSSFSQQFKRLAQKLYEAALKSRYSDVLPSTGGLRVIYDLKINKFVMARPHGEGGLRVHVDADGETSFTVVISVDGNRPPTLRVANRKSGIMKFYDGYLDSRSFWSVTVPPNSEYAFAGYLRQHAVEYVKRERVSSEIRKQKGKNKFPEEGVRFSVVGGT